MAKIIWNSDAQRNFFGRMSLEELRKEYIDATEEETIRGIPVNEADEDDFLDYFLFDGDGGDREDLLCNILPELKKQCYNDIIVFFGKAANWQGEFDSYAVKDFEFVAEDMFYPEYEATTEIYVEDGNLYFSESNHDVPCGFSMPLYSFKSKEAYEKAERVLLEIDKDFDMCYFLTEVTYDEIKMLVENGILTPVKNTINNYTGNEKED